MEKRNITVTLNKAKEWFNSGNAALEEIALQAFTKEELNRFNFTKIKTFEDACMALHYVVFNSTIEDIAAVSRASAAMFKLNIIRKALNLGQDLHLTDYSIYYPYNPLITFNTILYKDKLDINEIEIIGKIKNEEQEYYVLGGSAYRGANLGLGSFDYDIKRASANANVGFLGCATEEIAKHFGKYFGMLITEAKYGDMVDFEIIEATQHA